MVINRKSIIIASMLFLVSTCFLQAGTVMVRCVFPVAEDLIASAESSTLEAVFEYCFPNRYFDVMAILGLALDPKYYNSDVTLDFEIDFALGAGHRLWGTEKYSLHGLIYAGMGLILLETSEDAGSFFTGFMLENRIRIADEWNLVMAPGMDWRTPLWGSITCPYPFSLSLGVGCSFSADK